MFLVLLAVAAADPSEPVEKPSATWEVIRKNDPITDKLEITAKLTGDNARLEFMCSRNERPILVYAPEAFLGASGGRYTRYDLRDLIYRFDDGQPQKASWKYLNTYAVPYNDRATKELLSKILSSHTLVIRAERYDGGTIDSTFNTAYPQDLYRAMQHCGIIP